MESSSSRTSVPPRSTSSTSASTSHRPRNRPRRSREAPSSSRHRENDIDEDLSPPQTPKARNPGKSSSRSHRRDSERMRRLNTHAAPHETFLDDITPVDGPSYESLARHQRDCYRDDEEFDPRDSHDLTYGNLTRNSVVDNMLLSLDSFGMGDIVMPGSFPSGSPTTPTFYEGENDSRYGTTPATNGNTGRYRGHTYTSSYSSDYDLQQAEYMGRRSSSQYAPAKNGLHLSSARTSPERRHRGGYADSGATASHARSRGKKGSKGSGSSSLDYGYHQVLGSMRRSGGLGSRSASFDQGYERLVKSTSATQPDGMRKGGLHKTTTAPDRDHGRMQHQQQHYQYPQSPVEIGGGQGMDYYSNFDAAPTPTVPAGPRRGTPLASPATAGTPTAPNYPPPLPPSYAPPAPPVRKNSAKSSSSRMGRKKKAAAVQASKEALGTATLKGSGRNHKEQGNLPSADESQLDQLFSPVDNNHGGPGANPSSLIAGAGAGSSDLAAPSPNVSFHKSSTAIPSGQALPSTTAPKDTRPGFFRRVFGSSKNNSAQQAQQQQEQLRAQQQKQLQVQLENAQSLNVLTYRPTSPPASSPSPQQQPSSRNADMHHFRPSRRPKTQPSSSHIAGQLKTSPTAPPPTATHPNPTSSSPHGASKGRHSISRPSTHDENEEMPMPAPPQTLVKKGSSFFRRRKKSFVTETPPVPQSLQPAPPSRTGRPPMSSSSRQTQSRGEGDHLAEANGRPSESVPQPLSPSISSLRKVMDPFLTHGNGVEGAVDGHLKKDTSAAGTVGDVKSPQDLYFDSREMQSPTLADKDAMSANANAEINPSSNGDSGATARFAQMVGAADRTSADAPRDVVRPSTGIETGMSSGSTTTASSTLPATKPPSRHTLHDRPASSHPNLTEKLFSNPRSTSTPDSQRLKLKMRHPGSTNTAHRSRSPPKPLPHDDSTSFLADSSGPEDRSGRPSPVPQTFTHLSSRSSAVTEGSINQSGTPSPTFGLPEEQQQHQQQRSGKENVHPRQEKRYQAGTRTGDEDKLSPILSTAGSPRLRDANHNVGNLAVDANTNATHLSLDSASSSPRETSPGTGTPSRTSRSPIRAGQPEWPKRTASLSGRSGSATSRSNRVWLEPSSSEEKLAGVEDDKPKKINNKVVVDDEYDEDEDERLKLPMEGVRAVRVASAVREGEETGMDLSALDALDGVSPVSTDANANEEFASATSLPVVRVDTQEEEPKDEEKDPLPIDQEPDDEDREHAQKIFDGDESFLKKDLAAAWLGERVPRHARTRKAYMELFDWSGYNILLAFRDLCTRLVVKAESQQLDRVIDAFSQRWCACNLSHGFKSPDVVHTIAYSILMLNTDLHIADINERMTRSQFVKNTLPTIRRIADESAGDLQVEEVTTIRPTSTQIRFPLPWSQDSDTNKTSSSPTSPNFPATDAVDTIRGSLDAKRRSRSSPHVRGLANGSFRSESDGAAPLDTQNPGDACTVLVHTPYKGNMKGWEAQLEVVLREFYNSIRAQRLPLHGVTTANGHMLGEQQSNNSLAVMAGNVLRRTPSVLSKAPSDTVSYRGRADLRSMTGRWMPSKTRSRPRLTPGLTSSSTMGSSSRTSFDDGSVWSPATSHSTWSKYRHNSFMSVESLGSMSNAADYQRSIGFANALSQAIVREGSMNFGGSAVNLSEEMGNGGVALLEDESLELEGPPWAKEGILQHRHHLERVDRAGKDSKKDKGWAEAFAVIEKGVMRLFLFKHGAGKDSSSAMSKSLRIRSKKHLSNLVSGSSSSSSSPAPFAPVGGGNWLDNAEPAGEFLLRQTIASALPPPGFSPSRSHVWALSLPTGAVHLFQAGTPEMVVEWVTTANYWSARLSKAPLGEAVSNVEYGWGDGLLNASQQRTRTSTPTGETPPTSQGRTSRQSIATVDMRRPSTTSAVGLPRPSFASHDTARTSFEASFSASNSAVRSGTRPGDRATVHEWQQPTASMMASNLSEAEQLATLTAYVTTVEQELVTHNELRAAMRHVFSARHANTVRAMNNWERKSSYLLREIVKWRTYVEGLKEAGERKRGVDEKREKARIEKGEAEKEEKGSVENEEVETEEKVDEIPS